MAYSKIRALKWKMTTEIALYIQNKPIGMEVMHERNAHNVQTRIYFTSTPRSNITENIVKILLWEGFIESVRKHQERNRYFLVSTLRHQKRKTRKGIYRTRTFLKRISRPGLRIYTNYQGIPKVLGGMISMSKLIQSHKGLFF